MSIFIALVLLIISLFKPHFLWASEPLARSEHSDPIHYKQYLQKNNYVTLAKFLKASIIHSKTSEKIISLFEKARIHDLNKNQKLARLLYKRISLLQFEVPPSSAHRMMIFFSILKLAEQESYNQRKELLKQAITYEENFDKLKSHFSQSFIKIYIDTKKTTTQPLHFLDSYRGYSIVLANGIPVNSFLKLPIDIPIKWSLLSNVYRPVTQIMSFQQLKNKSPQTQPIALGSCDSPDLLWLSQNISIFYTSDCIKSTQADFSKSQLISSIKDIKEKSNQKESPLQKSLRNPSWSINKMIKSPWLWGGFAALATSYYLSHQSSKNIKPTHR